MLNEHTLNQLRTLRLDGMVRAIEDQASSTAAAALSFDDRLTLLVQREVAWRDDRLRISEERDRPFRHRDRRIRERDRAFR